MATSSANAAAVLDGLASRALLIVSGKGGVGRTTIAALLACAMARRGRRVLAATTGHDDRLAWMLGTDRLELEPAAVAHNLAIVRLDPAMCVKQYGALVLRSERISNAVFDNAVVRRLLAAVPGLDDFALLGKVWHEAIREDTFDMVVFDGPATGHLRYTLGVPSAILRTVPQGPLTREALAMDQTLRDPKRCSAVLVGLPEAWPLAELSELCVDLREGPGVDVPVVFVNGLWPELPRLAPPAPIHDPEGVTAPVFATIDTMARIAARQRESLRAWRTRPAGDNANVFTIPWRWEGLSGPDDASAMLQEIERAQPVSP